jgi:hypothetical protein
MSKIAFTPNASGTGTFSIASPGTNTDRTLTLPDATGTVVLADATQTLTNKSIAASQLTGDVAAARITSALNASGSAPIYACRAWVNFNGAGTVAINASGNVSSITDNGAGDYTVNFTTALPDANYCTQCTAYPKSTTNNINFAIGLHTSSITDAPTTKTTSAVRILIGASNATGGTLADMADVNVAIFR